MFSQSADELYRKHVDDFRPAEDQRHSSPRGQHSLRSSSFQPPMAFPPFRSAALNLSALRTLIELGDSKHSRSRLTDSQYDRVP